MVDPGKEFMGNVTGQMNKHKVKFKEVKLEITELKLLSREQIEH